MAQRAGEQVPQAYTVATARGGRHMYFTAPDGTTVKNSASQIAPMIDVRGRGGMAVGAGSVRFGRRYELVRDCEPAPLPGWLLRLATPPQQLRSCTAPAAGLNAPARRDRYAMAALTAEASAVATADAGRNTRLNRAAFSLGRLVGSGMLTEAEVTTGRGSLRPGALDG